jgi:hypothetical protein
MHPRQVSLHESVMVPNVAKRVVSAEGVALVRDWIREIQQTVESEAARKSETRYFRVLPIAIFFDRSTVTVT